MTFIVGLNCCDGIVLCTDSLEDDGITKKPVDKIKMMGTSEWGLAIAGSGGGRIVDKFCDEVKNRLPRGKFDRAAIETTIEQVLAEFDSKYVKTQDDLFEVIIAVHSGPGGQRLLYEGSRTFLSPVTDECHTGMGNEIWRMLAETMYDSKNCVEDNVRLAVFATQLAIHYASRVGEPVQVVSYTFGDQFWKVHPQGKVMRIEMELPLYHFQDAMKNYWRAHNPPTRWEQVQKYGGVRTPGDELTLLTGVKVEEMETGAGLSRVSGFLFGNRDRLRKRGILDKERGQKSGEHS